jgi:uncharacterized Rmd1/YagE family protein
MRRKEVIRKIGELMSLRMAVNTRGGGLEDTPEFYWSEPELEGGFYHPRSPGDFFLICF